MNRVRWGSLSTADIAMTTVIPAMQRGQYCDVLGIASRDLERARAAARQLGIRKAYGSYAELLADPEIDAVYIPLPNHLHVPWSIKALEAGKHVLCEKPIAMSAAEAERLLAAARRHPKLKVMEAFMYRQHPQWLRAKQLVVEGGIGELRTIQTFFSYYSVDPANIRNMADMGGGGLMDIGCYCISLSRFIFDAEPQRVVGMMEYDPLFGTDRLTSAIMDFGRGTSTWTCSTQVVPSQRVDIYGSKGRVAIEIPFNAPTDRPSILWHEHEGRIEKIALEVTNQYTIQGDAFSLAVLKGSEVPTPLTDAVANMRVIEAIFESGKRGQWVEM
jgi:predicted dehydrogenase